MVAHPREARARRYRQIGEVLARHGLDYFLSLTGLERALPLHRPPFGRDTAQKARSRPEQLRLALEELGTTFVKLGQILSTRPDLLPPEYQAELAKLQDQVAPIPSEQAIEVLTGELGRPLDELFAEFDPEPMAAASIGQVHTARLQDGTDVVVKIRRPGVVEQVDQDLDILQNLAAAASRRWAAAEQYDLVGLAQEFAQTLRAELDYIREGRSAERFARNFAGDPRIRIPRVFWEATTSRVLTLERVRGIKIDDAPSLDAAGINRPLLARHSSEIILKMVFEDGFFHADPHPGNFFVEPDGRIGLIDFGMAGVVDDATQAQLVDVFIAVTSQDPERMVDALLDLGVAGRRVNRNLLRRDLEHLLSRYYGLPLGEIKLTPMLTEAIAVIRRHSLHLPPNLALLLKTLMMDEALGTRLDPSFQLPTVLVPYAQRIMRRQYSPLLWARRFGRSGLEAARLSAELPQHLRRLIGELERGGLEVGMRPEGFDALVRRFERIANRIVLGIITAAAMIGLAILLSVYRPPIADQWAGAAFGLGFILVAALGTYLAWIILRSGPG